MERHGTSSVFVTDHDRHLKGVVTIDDAIGLQKKGEKDLGTVINADVYTTSPSTPISDLLATAIETRYPIALVDEEGRFQGAVSRAAIISEVNKGYEGSDVEQPQTLSELQDAQDGEE